MRCMMTTSFEFVLQLKTKKFNDLRHHFCHRHHSLFKLVEEEHQNVSLIQLMTATIPRDRVMKKLPLIVIRLLLVLVASFTLATAYHGPDIDFLKPFCGKPTNRQQCCNDRQDHCSHPIKDTICYCDQFCRDFSRGYDDCCPDYEEVCLGITTTTTTTTPTPPPPEILTPPCMYQERGYQDGQTIERNCNNCTCVANLATKNGRWECTQEPCIMDDDVVRNVNQRRTSWRAANYSQFYGKTLKDGVIYRLGTWDMTMEIKRVSPLRPSRTYGPAEIPFFDARTEWPNGFISPVRDQGWCGSDWAVTLTSIASDRMAIISKGAEVIELSPQLLLSCNMPQYGSCRGGRLDVAYNYAKKAGLVEEECMPYRAADLPMKYSSCRRNNCNRYKVSPLGKLVGEEDIKSEIKHSGPVHGIMKVYQDFFHYRGGIYRHLRDVGNEYIYGLHSVRIVGWGEEYGQKYWIVANSWGPEWGENGYFRILRGSNESGIEDSILTILPDVKKANQKK